MEGGMKSSLSPVPQPNIVREFFSTILVYHMLWGELPEDRSDQERETLKHWEEPWFGFGTFVSGEIPVMH